MRIAQIVPLEVEPGRELGHPLGHEIRGARDRYTEGSVADLNLAAAQRVASAIRSDTDAEATPWK